MKECYFLQVSTQFRKGTAIMSLFFSLTTQVGIEIGIEIYVALIDLLSADFMAPHDAETMGRFKFWLMSHSFLEQDSCPS
ncbi:hypothetical protein EJ110_NYTH40408 [Nymphaea thermarum]|nr:hypothetical protein EJ110_NYTH40408 [Nymphaea thermarum]